MRSPENSSGASTGLWAVGFADPLNPGICGSSYPLVATVHRPGGVLPRSTASFEVVANASPGRQVCRQNREREMQRGDQAELRDCVLGGAGSRAGAAVNGRGGSPLSPPNVCSSMPPTGLRAFVGVVIGCLFRDGSRSPGPRRTPAGLMDGGHQRRAGAADSEVRRIIVVATAHSPVLVPLPLPDISYMKCFGIGHFGVDWLRRRCVPVQSRHGRSRRALGSTRRRGEIARFLIGGPERGHRPSTNVTRQPSRAPTSGLTGRPVTTNTLLRKSSHL